MDILGTKRIESLKWFTMVGAITNDSRHADSVYNDGSPVPHQYVDLIAYDKDSLCLEKEGYLYCFPNDVWSFYGNNHGSIELTITRMA